MAVSAVAYPGCCTARILVGFGQESNAGGLARTYVNETVEQIKAGVDRLVRGHLIGRHYGIVSACLTSRQTRGIQALTELGFHSSGPKYKTGHRESQLLTFYVNPDEYIRDNPQPYIAPVVVRPAGGRLVKDLNRTARQNYDRLMRLSRYYTPGHDHYIAYREQARRMLTVDINFA
jgi:hypothetical protein